MFNLSAGGGWVVNATPQLLYCHERDLAPIVQEAGWTLRLVWMGLKNLACTMF
jgi:hypothetical protein